MIEIEKPTINKFIDQDGCYGKFVVEPLERGYGTTLGNALRRILLSSLPGAAVTSIKIDGILHEFSTIPGVKEDVTEIILNLKKLAVRLDGESTKRAIINAVGPKEVTAADIIGDSDMEIFNPDLHIATLEENATLVMEINLARGRGYVPAEQNKTESTPISVIPVDSIYTPVRKVNFTVENTRVGQVTDYDRLVLEILEIYEQHTDKGYRRIRDDLNRRYGEHVSDKRVLRLMRKEQIQSTIKHPRNCCTRSASKPQYIAENILARDFHAERPNEKWVTDVTEFKFYDGQDTRKLYLSAILDLFDRRIVSYVIRNRNDNELVLGTLDKALRDNPDAHPLLHSDRGFQYTSHSFHVRIQKHGMIHSMSRVGHCIDNGPMEGFWGILKREMYYRHIYESRNDLVNALEGYLHYYNFERLQRRLSIMTPQEYHNHYLAA